MAVQIQMRRDTAANFTLANTLLAQGEMGIETDTRRYKLGDGATAWNDLQYGALDGFTSGRRYQFDDATADADPGSGKVRFSHATFGSITHLYFDNADYPGGDATAWLDALDDSSNPGAKGTLFLQKHEDPGTYREFVVTGAVVDGTGYRKVPVAPLSSNGALSDDDQLVVAFYRAGDAGTIETDGSKSTLVDADAFIVKDSEDGGAAKEASLEDVRASLLGPVIIDDDTMASASDETVPTSESTKAYVDGKVSGLLIDEDDMVSDSDEHAPTQQSVKAYVDANSGGAWETIFDGDLSAASVHDFTDLSDFVDLRWNGFLIPASAGGYIGLRFSTDNGASFDTSSVYFRLAATHNYGSTGLAGAANSDTVVQLSSTATMHVGGLHTEGLLQNFNKASDMMVRFLGADRTSDGTLSVVRGVTRYTPTTARNAIRLFSSAGNSSGRLLLEGRRG